MTSAELSDPGTADVPEKHGQRGYRSPRRWVFGAIAAIVIAGAAAGAAYAAGVWDGTDDGALKQTLCGQPRKAGTPLGFLLPKDRPGVEQRNVTHDALDGRALHNCTVSVDGKTAISVMVTNMDPNRPPGGVTVNPKDFIAGGGVGAGAAGAVVMDYCPDNRSLVTTVSVSLDSGLRPAPGDDQEPAKRALTQLARAVLTAQSHEVC